ncbi:MAG: hypothetical protein K8R69_00460, partial [Deltaproteobacteria bacterium]|nr:hypothetical protein [Deltaproteobacteria bacterium]
ELSGNEKFSIVLFAANEGGGVFDFQLSGLNSPAQSKFLSNPGEVPLENDSADAEEDADATSALHERLREKEGELVDLEPYSPGSSENAGAGKAMAVTRNSCANGRGIYFNVLSSLSNNSVYETVCGIEVRRGGNAVYYIDESVINDLDDGAFNAILDDFEAKIPHERGLFGGESDVDENGTFSVLFSPAVNRLGNSGGGFITGYFFGGDLYPKSSIPGSNEQEVLFLCVPDPKGTWNVPLDRGFWNSNLGPSVLPHEFQHMISFNQHVLLRNDGAEEAWANEGISHFIEDLKADGSLNSVGPENPSRVFLYLAAPENAPFTTGISIPQRGGAYLFLRYLYEQANLGRYPGSDNGSDFLKKILQSGIKGIPNLEHATGWSFRNLLLDFYATVQLSNQGVSSDPRYNLQGISLVGSQSDNRGTVLQGVTGHELKKVPFGSQVQSPGAYFLEVSGDTLIAAGQGLSFSAPEGMMGGGIVIRIE